MTLQQIMYFQRVARSGSFTKAARACFVSQTAISRQICALEEELHVTLLERDTAHVKLTLAGEYFFQQVNELTARAGRGRDPDPDHRPGAADPPDPGHPHHPGAARHLPIAPSVPQPAPGSAAFHRGRLPAAAGQPAGGPEDRPCWSPMDFDLPDLEGLDSIILQQVHATWLRRPAPPCRSGKARAAAAAGRNADPDSRGPRGNTEELLRQYYNQLGLKGNPVLHTRTLEELFLLASAGVGVGLLPSSAPKYLRPDLCSVPIDGPQWSFSFLLISRRERSRASVRAMFELAEHL